MRVFVAAELDDVVRQAAAGVAAGLAAALEEGGARRTITWVAPEKMHFTLQFLGEVDPQRLKAVMDRLTRPLPVPPFDVSIAGVGTFPPAGPPRVIWMRADDGAAGLSAMFREVDRRLEGLGFPRDHRPFRAHLTLGRVRVPPGPRFQAVLARARNAVAGRCRIDHLTVFESRLSPAGSTYSVIAISPLGYHQAA
jgi:RNA 2',3'-cyclic 3'-phosphodiesterase